MKTTQNKTSLRLLLLSALVASTAGLAACTPNLNEDDGFSSGSKGGVFGVNSVGADGPVLAPLQATIGLGGTLVIQASGGVQPYTYQVAGAKGSIAKSSETSATYQAPTTEGVVQITITDAIGSTSQSSVTVSASAGAVGSLQISPSTASVVGGSTVSFSASGGRGTLSYRVVTANGGTLAANVFTASRALQTVTVEVSDTNGAKATATLTITMSADCRGAYQAQGSAFSGQVYVTGYNAANGAIVGWLRNQDGDKANFNGSCTLANGKGAFAFRLTDASGQGSGTFVPNAAGKNVITGTHSGGDIGNGSFTATQQ